MSGLKSKAVKQGMVAALAAVALGAPAYGAGLEGLGGVKANGYVEAQYNYNSNAPTTNANNFRVFDTTANSFTLNMAELALSKSTDAGLGFGLVLNYGADARILDATTGSPIFVQQAYVTDKAFGDAVDLKFGKFATLHGAEVIEGPANYNISRSFLFGYAIPFTHTGLRLHAEMGPMLSGHLGVNNGWDNDSDDNKGKSAELQVGLAPSDMLSLSVTGMYGPEATTGTHDDNRGLVDVVATLKPMDGLTLVFNYDRGSQAAAGGPGTGGDLWQGYAIYANLGLGDKHSVTLRGEVFDDQDGARTGTTQTLRELTLTFACKMKENLEWRAEIRHDEANRDAFTDDQGANSTDTQNTVALAAYYSF
jgi:hypothetical protein